MKHRLIFAVCALISGVSACGTRVAAPNNRTAITINPNNFTFAADRALPADQGAINRVLDQMPGGSASSTLYYLTGSSYSLKFRNDSLIVSLPYFGRSYSAPIRPDEQGITFATTAFRKNIRQTPKRLLAEFETTGLRENYRLTLDVLSLQSASLNVFSVNRQNISFQGHMVQTGR